MRLKQKRAPGAVLQIARGHRRASFGSHVRSVAAERGMDEDRETLQELGESLVEEDCAGFCSSVLRSADWRQGFPLVINGIRHAEVIRVLRSLVSPSRFILLYVHTPEQALEHRRGARAASNRLDWERIERHSTEVEVPTVVREAADLVLDGSRPADELADQVTAFMDTT